MISDKTLARQLLDLGNLEDMLKGSDIDCVLVEANDTIPVHMLVVPMEPDDQGRSRGFSCSYLSMEDEYLEHNTLLQIYSELPLELDMAKLSDLQSYLLAINMLQPIGHFGVKDGKVYYRYVLVLELYEIMRASEVLETLMVIEDCMDMYENSIDDLNSGQLSIADALSDLEI